MNKRLLHAAHVVLAEPVEAEGTEIALHDTVRAPLKGLQVYGKSTQKTTTGAQLLDVNAVADNNESLRLVENNGYTLINKSKTAYAPIQWIVNVIENTDYSLSIDAISEDEAYVQISTHVYLLPDAVDKVDARVYSNRKKITFGTKSNTKLVLSVFSTSNVEKTLRVDGIMINAGSTALPWEPYTGGAPSPSPDYPQEIVSVGDVGSIEVNISGNRGQDIQSAVLETPNGLPGIPVSSGGNCTDADGQQWVCDEVDFARGVYVHNLTNDVFDGSDDEKWNLQSINDYGIANFYILYRQGVSSHVFKKLMCNMLEVQYYVIADAKTEGVYPNGERLYVRINSSKASTVEQFRDLLKNSPLHLITKAKEPTETPLSAAELAAYKALHSNYPTTIITNSEDAHMKVNCLKIRGGG